MSDWTKLLLLSLLLLAWQAPCPVRAQLPPGPPERIPPPQGFPPLPPDPAEDGLQALPPLEEELRLHGGSYLYAPEGDGWHQPFPSADQHFPVLRLPEGWRAPQPITLFDDFLGTGPIPGGPHLHWPASGYDWDPRFVLYGAYQLFGIALEADDRHQHLVGHQLFVEMDLRLTGTERAHLQWRPIGRRNTGGSYYQFSDPSGYVDNSTGIPDRYWIEAELASLLGGLIHDPFVPRDYHLVLGKYPLELHNRLLINDDILGFVVNKNTNYVGPLSNLNLQAFFGLDDVDAFENGWGDVYGINAFVDYRRLFFESTYAYLRRNRLSGGDAHYLAISGTKPCGTVTLTGRALFKIGDRAGRGSGQLYVIEINRPRIHDGKLLGIEKGVYYATAFRATKGWNSISGGNFDRLRIAFAVDPLVTISASPDPADNTGIALGVQWFRRHEDESLIPEFAFQAPTGTPVYGVGLRYQRKTSARSFFQIEAIGNFSDDPTFRRQGLSISETILF
ncbi:MAG: hypothetical protein GTO53_02230 [Planctomycetales bacterium]|nr:hypothetical protein [Planctomycetales bacterium]NIM07986.1 hypothetical protein [Planctomycetales bacterium]NIN07464.1 hypothetical protein [Planctomycetales bacterium]NIN76570.1 hypothetical protein [Planctomycetales bacterium]NIO33758.1 hypothetical protein [Planctomycetales bacterium]